MTRLRWYAYDYGEAYKSFQVSSVGKYYNSLTFNATVKS